MDRENRMGVDAGYGLTGLGVRKRKGFFAFEREVKLDTDRCDVRSPDLHRRVDGGIRHELCLMFLSRPESFANAISGAVTNIPGRLDGLLWVHTLVDGDREERRKHLLPGHVAEINGPVRIRIELVVRRIVI